LKKIFFAIETLFFFYSIILDKDAAFLNIPKNLIKTLRFSKAAFGVKGHSLTRVYASLK
jgi:hypothetical protein